MAKTTIAGLLLVMLLVCSWTAEAGPCKDANGNPIPCEQDPGGGGIGGDPCNDSRKGYCRFQTIYPNGYWCEAGWCEPDPAAFFKCASLNTMTCEQGVNPDGSVDYLMINNCASCWG